MPNYVVCMKWGDKYGSDYVNRLARMVQGHCSLDYRFVCFTDDAAGIGKDIETRALPPCELPDRPRHEAWRKLSLFGPGMGISGTCLFLDLDLVVTGSLDAFFLHAGSFCIIHNWTHPSRHVGNSSVMRFEAGRHVDVFREFTRDPDGIASSYRNEQIFLSSRIREGTGLTWWPPEWCRSYKKHCIAPGIRRLFREPAIPEGCKIVVFHGRPNPPEAAHRWVHRSDKPMRLPKFSRPASWICDRWCVDHP